MDLCGFGFGILIYNKMASSVTVKGTMPDKAYRMIAQGLKKSFWKSVDEILVLAKDAAILHYKDKRLSSDPKSLIIESFSYDKPFDSGSLEISGEVTAGSGEAGYAHYVNDGHALRNGEWWEGYHFMEVGRDVAKLASLGIVNKNLRKIV